MPKRTRDHVREDRSRTAFEQLIEPWVYRSIKPDYGIDCEVEIVDREDEVTGTTLKAQLKATDSDDLTKALGVRVKTDTYFYALRQDVPALLIRYHAPTDVFYARWFHAFEVAPTANQKTVTLRLTEGDRLDRAGLRRLRSDAKTFKRLRSAGNVRRVGIRLWLPSGSARGFSKARLRSALEDLLGRHQQSGLYVTADEDSIVSVRITDKELSVQVAGGRLIKIDYHTNPEADLSTLCRDILVAVAASLARLGHQVLAAPILSDFFEQCSAVGDPCAATEIGMTFVRANRIDDLLGLMGRLLDRGDGVGWDAVKCMSLSVIGASLSDQESFSYQRLLRRKIDIAADLGDATSQGESTYNLGNFVRAQQRYPAAIELYDEAAQADPSYLNRDYWYLERAGCQFLSGDIVGAVEGYKRALDMGTTDAIARATYADALMFAGQYREALDNFLKYEADENEPGAEWTMKAIALRWLCHGPLRMRDQARDASAAADQLAQLSPDPDATELASRSEAALSKDALCGSALMSWAIAQHQQGRQLEDVACATLLGALVLEADEEAWFRALVTLAQVDTLEPLVQTVLDVAYWRCGEQFVNTLEDRYLKATGGPIPDELGAMLEAAAESVAEHHNPAVIRFIESTSGRFDIVEVPTE